MTRTGWTLADTLWLAAGDAERRVCVPTQERDEVSPMDIGIKVAIVFLSIFVVFGGIIAVIVGYGDWRRSKMERG